MVRLQNMLIVNKITQVNFEHEELQKDLTIEIKCQVAFVNTKQFTWKNNPSVLRQR